MSNTAKNRFEVGQEKYGQIENVPSFKEATRIAHNWLDNPKVKNKSGVFIFDRMAHKDKTQLWSVTICTGEAHSNPYIDHCSECMPNWGIVVTGTEIKES